LRREFEDLKETLNLKILYIIEKKVLNSDINRASLEEYELGLVTPEIIKKTFPHEKHRDLLIMLCGSKSMTRFYLEPLLIHDLKYPSDQVFSY
jgi:hypothetical protein